MTKSTRSETRSPASRRGRSITSWTTPEPGDTLNYSYLWAREAARGQEEGVKDRPVAVVVALGDAEGTAPKLFVAPITTQPPVDPGAAIEVPNTLKKPAGLDAARCWVVLTELNIFRWPGPDVRPVEGNPDRSPIMGAFPARFYESIREGVQGHIDARRFSEVDRR